MSAEPSCSAATSRSPAARDGQHAEVQALADEEAFALGYEQRQRKNRPQRRIGLRIGKVTISADAVWQAQREAIAARGADDQAARPHRLLSLRSNHLAPSTQREFAAQGRDALIA